MIGSKEIELHEERVLEEIAVKVAMVTGSYPPDVCGVGDYTEALVNSLEKLGASVEVVSGLHWGIGGTSSILKHLKSLAPDIIHLQYPTIGYGYGLAPQMLSLVTPIVVTLHEASQARLSRQLSLIPFLFRARHLIFTNAFDRDYMIHFMPQSNSRTTIIPIGSNIPVGMGPKDNNRAIVYFGLIRPNKGLEDFLAAAAGAARRNLGFEFTIIGSVDSRCKDYFQKIRLQSENLPVSWALDLPENEVAELLSRMHVGYLPFPDGASERRGSLLALLVNEVVPVTRKSHLTSPGLTQVAQFVDTPEQALDAISMLFASPEKRCVLRKRGKKYIQNFKWEIIAREHIGLYSRLCSSI